MNAGNASKPTLDYQSRKVAVNQLSTSAAAAAFAENERRRAEEEERLTRYSAEELADGWEFKILRGSAGTFRKPATFERACAEEAVNDWVLVEKFDDSRLRFKRPVSARCKPVLGDIDPYRTRFSISDGARVAIIFAIALSVLLIVAFVEFVVR
jgi:hypothetical protein